MSLGGGERYVLTAAEALRDLGPIDVLSEWPADLGHLAEEFGLDLRGVRFVHRPRARFQGALDWLRRRPYDFFLALDNHLAPTHVSLGRRGVLHLQAPPYAPRFARPIRDRLKLGSYDVVLCNSEYTRRWAIRHGTNGLPTRVVHPPIDVDLYQRATKRPMILSVGRFFVGRHEKKHDLSIDAFRELVESGLRGWELVLAGSLRAGNAEHTAYLEQLRDRARGLPVRFVVDATLLELRHLYAEANLYWHATGFGVDEELHPQYLEHFGMAIVEAMAAGAIPIVIGKGGPLEILHSGEDGFSWTTEAELIRLTLDLARRPEADLTRLRERAVENAQRFAKPRFAEQIRSLATELCDR